MNSYKTTEVIENRFKCDTCEQYFLTKDDLSIHVRTHARVRPFKCDICGAYFLCSSHLKVHIRIHSGE